jgi:hypothetical protein
MLVRVNLLALLSVLLASVAFLAGGRLAAQDKALQRTATEKSLGKVDLSTYDKKQPTFWISPNGKHAAWLVATNKIAIDGQVKEHQRDLSDKSFRFSPDGEHWGYAVYIPDKGATVIVDGVEQKTGYNQILFNPFFSPDGKHVAYFASQYVGGDMHEFFVLDGKQSQPFERSNHTVYFSPDSKKVMFGMEVGDKNIFRTQTIDGQEPPTDLVLKSITLNTVFFGPGGQIGYIGSAGEDQSFVFYDGKEDGLKFDEIKNEIVFSDDGKHIAYIAEPGGFDDVAVIGGKASKVYSGFEDIIPGTLALSPDGSRSAYSAKKSREQWVVLDGKDSKKYPRVGGAVFSPDSKHVAYQASASGKLFNVVDGREGQPYDKIGMPQFSPDSSTVAYWAQAGGKQFIVAGGQKQKVYDSVGTPIFAPDSKRLAYLAESGGKWLLVDAGKEGTAYDDIDGTLYFSDDGQRLATIVASGEEQTVIVNSSEGKRYDTIVTIAGGRLHWTAGDKATGDKLHYLATKGDELLLVEETIAK